VKVEKAVRVRKVAMATTVQTEEEVTTEIKAAGTEKTMAATRIREE